MVVEQIDVDFVFGILKTLRKYFICVIVFWLTKSAYFILVKVTYNTTKLARIYAKMIVRLLGVPISIISTRVKQLTFNFWKNSKEDFGTRFDLSNIFIIR